MLNCCRKRCSHSFKTRDSTLGSIPQSLGNETAEVLRDCCGRCTRLYRLLDVLRPRLRPVPQIRHHIRSPFASRTHAVGHAPSHGATGLGSQKQPSSSSDCQSDQHSSHKALVGHRATLLTPMREFVPGLKSRNTRTEFHRENAKGRKHEKGSGFGNPSASSGVAIRKSPPSSECVHTVYPLARDLGRVR